MYSYKNQITGPELNAVNVALTALIGTEFHKKFEDRYERAEKVICNIRDADTRRSLWAKFETIIYGFRQVCSVIQRVGLDKPTLDELEATRDSSVRSVLRILDGMDSAPTRGHDVAPTVKVQVTKEVSIESDSEDGNAEVTEIEVPNEYAATPIVVKHLDGAEEALARFGANREKLLAPTTKNWRSAKFPLVVMTEPFLSTEDLAKLGFETESMSIYQVFHGQRILAVRNERKLGKKFAAAKDEIIHELSAIMATAKDKATGLRGLLPDTEAFWVKYDRNVGAYVKAKTEAEAEVAKADQNIAKLTNRRAKDETERAKWVKQGMKKTDPKYKASMASSVDDLKRINYFTAQKVDPLAEIEAAVAKIAKADERASEYYTLEDLNGMIAKHKATWEKAKASRALVKDDKLDDNARDVWAKLQKVYEDLEEEQPDYLQEALKDLQEKTGEKMVLVTENPIRYAGTEFDYYWVMPNKSYMRLINGSTSAKARQTSYTKITQWGFAF